jgi:organic radical activating enzyme
MIKIPILDATNIEHCNFSCLNCAVAAPYKVAKFYQPEQYSDSIGKLSEYLRVGSLHVLGGEPFLDNNLYKFIQGLGWQRLADKLEVITNGFWLKDNIAKADQIMSIPGTTLSISTHPENLIAEDIVDRRNNIFYLLNKYGKDRVFIRAQERFSAAHFTQQEQPSKSCAYASCVALTADAKIVRCNIIKYAKHFPNTTKQFNRESEIGLYDITKGCEKDFIVWYNTMPRACNFCSGTQFDQPHLDKPDIDMLLTTGAQCL